MSIGPERISFQVSSPVAGIGQDCGGGGENREVHTEDHTLNSMKDDRRVSPAEVEERWRCK